MKIKTISITLITLTLVGLIGYRITKNNAESEKSGGKGDKKPPMMVDAIVVSETNFANTISLSVLLKPMKMWKSEVKFLEL